jgi:hypothetical protein
MLLMRLLLGHRKSRLANHRESGRGVWRGSV